MTQFTIPGHAILANTELDSAGVTLPSNISDIVIILTDPNAVWDTTVGHVKQWGLQISTDNGSTWNWGPIYQGNAADSNLWLPFGSHSRLGAMPALHLSRTDVIAQSGHRLRLAILTDTAIVLGAQVTVT